ncbi:MAG: efflux RND transporter periplasmic adaptor subunit [Chromatiales bacterium]|jgi:RND family efflux transporter MFP subunit
MKKQISSMVLATLCWFSAAGLAAADIEAVLDWSGRAALGTTVNGKIIKVNVQAGDRVTQDQPLVELDGRYFQSRMELARAEMQHKKLLLEEAQREQARAAELFDRTVLSEFDRQKADNELAAAEAAYQAARTAYRTAQLDLEYSRILAPYDSIVLRVAAQPGEVVVNTNETRVLVEVARADQMLARALLSAEALASLKIGQSIQVAVQGQWLDGQLQRIGLQPASVSGRNALYEIEVSFPLNEQLPARAGEASALRIGAE